MSAACVRVCYQGASDLPALLGFASRTTFARLPRKSRWHPGDIAWALRAHDCTASLASVDLWWREGEVVAAAMWDGAPGTDCSFTFDVSPSHLGAVLPQLLADAQRRHAVRPDARGQALTTLAFARDTATHSLLMDAGFRASRAGAVHLECQLGAHIAEPSLPVGMHFADARTVGAAERIDVHRAAWSALDHIGLPQARSGFDALQLRRVVGAPNYEPVLDVLIAEGSRCVASALCWADAHSGVGLTEPVGTRPELRRQGLSRAVNTECLQRLRARGMHVAVIQTARFNLPAQATYRSCGYVQADEDIEYVWTPQA